LYRRQPAAPAESRSVGPAQPSNHWQTPGLQQPLDDFVIALLAGKSAPGGQAVPAARVRAAYPGATWDRLAAVKRRYDPGNLFRHNHNIPPATTI
jgi:hypothetical protein